MSVKQSRPSRKTATYRPSAPRFCSVKYYVSFFPNLQNELKIELPWLEDVTRAKPSEKIPLVFTKNEIQMVLANDIRTVQELLGHKDVRTTMIYPPVLNKGGQGVISPSDQLSG
jgi:hypothetical protein